MKKDLCLCPGALERLKAVYKAHKQAGGLTQIEVSRRLGYESDSAFGNILSGHQQLSIELLSRICGVLNIELAAIDPDLVETMHQYTSDQPVWDVEKLGAYYGAVMKLAPDLEEPVRLKVVAKAYKLNADDSGIRDLIELARL